MSAWRPSARISRRSAADLPWVINAYLLPLSALLLLGGAAGDRYGRMRLLVAGHRSCSAWPRSPAPWRPACPGCWRARAVQGIGAAMLMPNSLAILGASFSGEARGRAIGIWAAMGAVMGAAGPVLGGWLIDTVGWRAIFLINLPLAARRRSAGAGFRARTRPERGRPGAGSAGRIAGDGGAGRDHLGPDHRRGAGRAGPFWPSSLAAAGIALMLGFLAVEKARGERAMMPLALFGSASFIGLTIFTWLLYGALGALMVLVPYVLIQAGGYSGTGAGAALVPFALVLTVGSPVMGGVAGRMGPRLPLTIGALVVGAGFLLLLRMGAAANYWTDVFPGILVIAIGMSGAVAPLTTAVLSSVDSAPYRLGLRSQQRGGAHRGHGRDRRCWAACWGRRARR